MKNTTTPTFAKASAGKQRKTDLVKDISEKLGKAKALVLTDYTGVTHKQLEELRKNLKKVEAELTIVKNRLFKIALKENHKTIDDTFLNGSTAALFAYQDEVAPLKELVKFFKTSNLTDKLKTGLLGEQVLTTDEINRFATLPTREILLSQLVRQLQAPIYGLHNALSWNLKKLVWTLNNIKNSKS